MVFGFIFSCWCFIVTLVHGSSFILSTFSPLAWRSSPVHRSLPFTRRAPFHWQSGFVPRLKCFRVLSASECVFFLLCQFDRAPTFRAVFGRNTFPVLWPLQESSPVNTSDTKLGKLDCEVWTGSSSLVWHRSLSVCSSPMHPDMWLNTKLSQHIHQ